MVLSTLTTGSTTTSVCLNPRFDRMILVAHLGGPVEIPRLYNGKDKTFFFVSYEGLRLTAPQAADRQLCARRCLAGKCWRRPCKQVLDAFPVQSPNGIDDTVNGIAQFIGSWSNPASIDSTSVAIRSR